MGWGPGGIPSLVRGSQLAHESSGAHSELQMKVAVVFSVLLQGRCWGQGHTGGCPSCTVEVVDETVGFVWSKAPLSSDLTGRRSYLTPRRI